MTHANAQAVVMAVFVVITTIAWLHLIMSFRLSFRKLDVRAARNRIALPTPGWSSRLRELQRQLQLRVLMHGALGLRDLQMLQFRLCWCSQRAT